MNSDSQLLSPQPTSRRFYKFTVLTPHSYLPPDHPASLEDELAEEFAIYLCDRVSSLLGARTYMPKKSGEAFLNMDFDEFEERFLRNSEFAIFITSGVNAACLDVIYPRMLVFFTIRPTWRNRAMVVYIGQPSEQQIYDQNLFATEALIFSLNRDEWESEGSPWQRLLGTLQTKVPLTPELKRPQSSMRRHVPSAQNSTVDTDAKAANGDEAGVVVRARDQSEDSLEEPIKTHLPSTQRSSAFAEQGDSAPPCPSPRVGGFSRSLRQEDSRLCTHNVHRSRSLDDMCFLEPFFHARKPFRKKRKRRNSDTLIIKNMPGFSLAENKEGRCSHPSVLQSPKLTHVKQGNSESTFDHPPESVVINSPEVIRVSIPHTSSPRPGKKPMNTFCLQVQVEEPAGRRCSANGTLSASPKQETQATSKHSRKGKPRNDSGIMCNSSLVSTETSCSSPSLSDRPPTSPSASPSTFASSSLSSSHEYTEKEWLSSRTNREVLSPSLVPFSSQTQNTPSQRLDDSSLNEHQLSMLDDTMKYADDETLNDETIHSDLSGSCETEPFVRPGLPPLKKQNSSDVSSPFHDLVVEPVQGAFVELAPPAEMFQNNRNSCQGPRIMNPDSKASSESLDDPTLQDASDVEFTQDSSLRCSYPLHQHHEQPLADEFNSTIQPHLTHSEHAVQSYQETDIDQLDDRSGSSEAQKRGVPQRDVKSPAPIQEDLIPTVKSTILQQLPPASDNADTFDGLPSEYSADGISTRNAAFPEHNHIRGHSNHESFEVIHDLRKQISPETLELVKRAVKSYDEYPSLVLSEIDQDDRVTPTSPLPRIQRPHFLRRTFPQAFVAVLNLSTAYIPRYLSSLFDYSHASLSGTPLTPSHPDGRLRWLTATAQDAILDHPLGASTLLAGTTLVSPYILRQFPLTLLASCGALSQAFYAVLREPSAFFSDRFADLVGVFHATPTWAVFSVVGSRGVHWRQVAPS
uniref:HECT-type E3 ubiquitin transferase n=1 Tax=Mesocestoides corti TaxID=53468 RepID=A0A5K3FDR9_MESCO